MIRKNNWPMKSFLVTLSTFLALVVFVSANADNNKKDNPEIEQLSIAGTFLTSRMDANSDGDAASWCTSQVKGGHQGSSTMQCINESFQQGPTTECPGGFFIVDAANGLGGGAGTRTFPNAEDQIFFVLTERELCANAVGQLTGVDSGIIVGGIGRYVGAQGTFEHIYSGNFQYFDFAAQPAQTFGAINGTGTWVINFPE